LSKEGVKRQPVFTKRREGFCLSCLDRDAINLLGRPRYVRGVPLTYGCEECGGKGRIILPDHHRADPYSRP
jgi:hypothetical protein